MASWTFYFLDKCWPLLKKEDKWFVLIFNLGQLFFYMFLACFGKPSEITKFLKIWHLTQKCFQRIFGTKLIKSTLQLELIFALGGIGEFFSLHMTHSYFWEREYCTVNPEDFPREVVKAACSCFCSVIGNYSQLILCSFVTLIF